jgi:hypothetical protein
MLHFSFKKKNLEPPESLYHHAYELWKLIKLCTFPDGRLLRIGGDTRVRYCYCQDYAIPMWNFVRDKYGETDCDHYEESWLKKVKKEVAANGDGSFLGERAKTLTGCSPLYYTRLEADRAATISMTAHWRSFFNNFSNTPQAMEQAQKLGSWHDEFHGSCFVKSKKRAVSWTWIAAERPQGLCLPTNKSDMAEWKQNLAAHIKGTGLCPCAPEITKHSESTFENGFATIGEVKIKSLMQLAEGQPEDVTAIQKIAFAALPDNTTAICFQYAKTPYRVYIKESKGLALQIPNDIFNDYKRTYFTDGENYELQGCPGKEELIDLNAKWLNVDNVLGVNLFHGGNISINRPAQRQIAMRDKETAGGMLYADEICAQISKELKAGEKGERIVDVGFSTMICDKEKTALMASSNEISNGDEFRSVKLLGADEKIYIFVANFGETECEASYSMTSQGEAKELTGAEVLKFDRELRIKCAPDSCRLFQVG